MLVNIDNVLTPDELAAARELLARSRWDSGIVSGGPGAAQAKKNQQLAEDAEHLPTLRRLVLDALNRDPIFFAAALPLKIFPPLFYRYVGEANNTFGFHADGAMRLVPGQPGVYVRADISATMFFSDPASYDGGVVTIEDTFGNHGIKLKAGAVAVHPASPIHAVTPVTRGERIVCLVVVQSMVRDPGQRRLLYDMDMALLKLRQEIGETDPVVRLTGVYHNLLRRWVEN